MLARPPDPVIGTAPPAQAADAKTGRRRGLGCESVGHMDLTEAAAAWRRDGYAVLPGYLAGPELDAARADLARVFPSAAEYHDAPDQGRNREFTGDEFGGIIAFPFPAVALSRLVVHDKLIDLA
jgi:hypothetical protein